MKWIERITRWLRGSGKSRGPMGPGLRAAISGGMPGGWASDHREETAHNTGFNYIAIHAIASQVAGATVTVFADGDQQAQRQSRRKVLAYRLGSFSRWKSIYGADDRETDPLPATHPLVRLLKRPNPQESGASFRYRQAQQMRLTGTCLVWNVPSISGLTCERYVIPTAMASPVSYSAELPLGGWRINPVASRYTQVVDEGYLDCPSWYRVLGQIIDARQVQVIRIPHAWYLDDGQSPLAAGAKWIDAGEAVDEARYHQLKNGIDPSIVWNLPPDVSPDQDEMDRIQSKISSKYGGPENVGRVMVAQSGTSITPLSSSPKEMCFSEGFQDFKSAVLALHQTPPVAVGLQEPGAYAAYNASMKAWRHAAIQPLCDLLAESETEYLAPQFGDGLTVEIESDTVDDSDLIERQLQNDLAAKVRTRNEWRAVRGMSPLSGPRGDELVGTDEGSSHGKANSAMADSDLVSNLSRDQGFPSQTPSPRFRPPEKSPRPGNANAREPDTKSYDPFLHPHDLPGRFAEKNSPIEHKVVDAILCGVTLPMSVDEVKHHISKVSAAYLRKYHEKNNIVPVPRTREHLERSVIARMIGYPTSGNPTFAKPTGSRTTSVHVKNPDVVNQRLPADPSGKTRPPLTMRQWGQLVGARPGATVHVFPEALNQITIVSDHPDYYSRSILRSNTQEIEQILVAPGKQKRGIGFRIFSQQVKTAKGLGYHVIKAGAAGHGDKITVEDHNWEAQGLIHPNGYYTWPRLGFDGNIHQVMRKRSRLKNKELNDVAADFYKKFPNVKKVSQLMLTKRGRDWWKAYGGYFVGTFKLSDTSISHRVLIKYTCEKRKKSGGKSLSNQSHPEGFDEPIHQSAGTAAGGHRDLLNHGWNHGGNSTQAEATSPVCEEPDPLSPEDEEILDRVWDDIASERKSDGRRNESDFEIDERSPDVVS